MQAMRDSVPRQGLKAPFGGATVHAVAREVVAIAAAGLRRRAIPDVRDTSEEPYLDELKEIVESGITPAERLLDRYATVWRGDIGKLYEEESY
jgi:glutamate--cysteine ligase